MHTNLHYYSVFHQCTPYRRPEALSVYTVQAAGYTGAVGADTSKGGKGKADKKRKRMQDFDDSEDDAPAGVFV